MDTLPIQKLHADAKIPTRANSTDAGLDLSALEHVIFEAGQIKLVRTGIAIGLAAGTVGLIADRSSMAKKGFKTAGGVIDAGYRGEIQVVLMNLSTQAMTLQPGDRIAQLLIQPILTPQTQEVTGLDSTARGDKGFGSSGL